MIKNNIKLVVTETSNLVDVIFESDCSGYEPDEIAVFTKLSDDQSKVTSIIIAIDEDRLSVEQISKIVRDVCSDIAEKHPLFKSCLNNGLVINI